MTRRINRSILAAAIAACMFTSTVARADVTAAAVGKDSVTVTVKGKGGGGAISVITWVSNDDPPKNPVNEQNYSMLGCVVPLDANGDGSHTEKMSNVDTDYAKKGHKVVTGGRPGFGGPSATNVGKV